MATLGGILGATIVVVLFLAFAAALAWLASIFSREMR